MRRTRRRLWWRAAGFLLAATAASPVLGQALPGAVALPDDVPPGFPPPVTQPARPLPARTAIRQAPAAPPEAPVDGTILPAPRTQVTPTPAAPPPQPVVIVPAPVTAAPACEPAGAAAGGHGSWWHWHKKRADCQAIFWGYPEEFVAPPLGATIHAHFRTMVANGEAAAMVLYRCDFLDHCDTLNQRGRDQLTKIACLLAHNDFPIIIERTPDNPALAESRRLAVLNVLAHNAIVLAPERVLVGPPIANGLSGIEAEALHRYFLNNLAVQAVPITVPSRGAASTGGFGGGQIGGGGFGGGR
jgi:hypothetical protein